MYAYFTKYSWLLRTQARNIIFLNWMARGGGLLPKKKIHMQKNFANL